MKVETLDQTLAVSIGTVITDTVDKVFFLREWPLVDRIRLVKLIIIYTDISHA